MSMLSIVLALCLASATAFQPRTPVALVARRNLVSAEATLPRIIEDPLPNVYVYDHCPFCVRVRLALGVKNIKHNLVFLGNDDIPTPTALVGKKVAPILQMPGDDMVMGESLDICAYFDTNEERFGPSVIKPASDRKDIKAWQKGLQTTMRCLTRPRYMKTCLPEFMQQDGKDAFVKNHQIPPFEKAEWKTGDMTMEAKWTKYDEALEKTGDHLPTLNEALKELETMIFSDEYCTEGGFSYDDIDLWSRLRSLTLIKGAEFGPKTMAYMKRYEKEGDVPLYFNMPV